MNFLKRTVASVLCLTFLYSNAASAQCDGVVFGAQCLSATSSSESSISGTAPSSYFTGVSGPTGSALIYNTGSASGGPSKVYLQRFDLNGVESGAPIELQSSVEGSGPVHAVWLSNDSIAVSFFSYASGRYRTELRIVDDTNNILHSGIVIGDSGNDYLPQSLVDMGNNEFVVSYNRTPNHPQLPAQQAYLKRFTYEGFEIAPAFSIV
jgi:hypothetical protein